PGVAVERAGRAGPGQIRRARQDPGRIGATALADRRIPGHRPLGHAQVRHRPEGTRAPGGSVTGGAPEPIAPRVYADAALHVRVRATEFPGFLLAAKYTGAPQGPTCTRTPSGRSRA